MPNSLTDSSLVKQEISRLGVTPIPEFWASTSSRGTPAPALLLHWFFSVLVILLTPLGSKDGFLIVSTLYSYAHTWINGKRKPFPHLTTDDLCTCSPGSVLIGSSLLCAPFLAAFNYPDGTKWKPRSSRLGFIKLVPLTVVYVLANIFIIVLSWYPTDMQHLLGSKAYILPSYTSPIIGTSVFAVGIIYWIWDRHFLPLIGYHFGREEEELKGGGVQVTFNVGPVDFTLTLPCRADMMILARYQQNRRLAL
jgi:hypothetical protein